MDLNDDCLREILDRLDDVEYLASVARVCSRLKKLVHMNVSSKNKPIEFVVKSVQGAEICLAEFGRSIHSLRLVFNRLDRLFHADILVLLQIFCGGTLVCLEMIGLDWPSMFGVLTTRFLPTAPTDFYGISLKRIRLGLASVIECNTEKLEYFEFDGKKMTLYWEISNAISKLRKLKTLKIYVSTGEKHHFRHMIENLSELDELRISTSHNPFNESDLLNVIRHKHNLHLFCLGSRYNGNDSTNQNHLDLILLRSNRESLQIVLVGTQHKLTHIDVAFNMHPSLKITEQTMSEGIDEWISRYGSEHLQ